MKYANSYLHYYGCFLRRQQSFMWKYVSLMLEIAVTNHARFKVLHFKQFFREAEYDGFLVHKSTDKRFLSLEANSITENSACGSML